jgi:AraC-like DNA-binding protein
MNYLTIRPKPRLAGYVRQFWVLEGEASLDKPYIHRSMAGGCVELIFHYMGTFDELISNTTTEKSIASGLVGQSRTFKRFAITEDFGIFSAYLYPFAIPHLFSIPADIITNQVLDLKNLIGTEANELEEKMMLAPNCSARVEIISEFLEGKLNKTEQQPSGIFETIKYILQTNGTANVEELAKRNFLSARQFERNFKQFSGFSPKLFSRISRFQNSLKAYNKEKPLTEIAYEAGYYDQSHFIQDFKEFSGHNPKEYFSYKAEGTEWREN